jgi:hypothetical protein
MTDQHDAQRRVRMAARAGRDVGDHFGGGGNGNSLALKARGL